MLGLLSVMPQEAKKVLKYQNYSTCIIFPSVSLCCVSMAGSFLFETSMQDDMKQIGAFRSDRAGVIQGVPLTSRITLGKLLSVLRPHFLPLLENGTNNIPTSEECYKN